MDEILIEEKKYVSSKQAAKMTGYAKDYIGQLCREGRVPARLIGRSWYVLEAAIQDHRFGNPVIESTDIEEDTKKEDTPEKELPVSTWESPGYEATSSEPLPPISHKDKELDEFSDRREDVNNEEQYIQDSWKAWFDRFDHTETEETESSVREEPIAQEILEETKEEETDEENIGEVKIPIHTVSRPLYHLPPEELLPRNAIHHLEATLPKEPVSKKRRGNKGLFMTIQMVGAMLAVITMTLAVLGSGYLDEYVTSSKQTSMMAGVILFNR